jgi:hypothetical protein
MRAQKTESSVAMVTQNSVVLALLRPRSASSSVRRYSSLLQRGGDDEGKEMFHC